MHELMLDQQDFFLSMPCHFLYRLVGYARYARSAIVPKVPKLLETLPGEKLETLVESSDYRGTPRVRFRR